MKTIPCFHVDAFTDVPFRGNPAAVCLLDAARPARWMQATAAEMNLSETAFVRPTAKGFSLRWFTPEIEVDLCGHATLATAHVLWQERIVAGPQELVFQTNSGRLTANRAGKAIELDFPQRLARPCARPAGLARALGCAPRAVARSEDDLLVEVASERLVRELQPDLAMLRRLPVRGVIVTAKAAQKWDFVSRFFAPRVGVDEDPVTGSAHCSLAPYWAQRLGATRMRGFQASARGGVVEVEVRDDRVLLRGAAVTVVRGELVAR
ncbi:MAG TPA: PhzF family phenazine biosynthesis protein [Planctomycetota bacterium]|nr:PhzF family phenazine biosynthesis protein [Planctomycetota bacterium]